MSDTDWITEGAEVAILTGGFAGDVVNFTTIERLTATQIVLASGSRYNRKTMRQVGASSAWRFDRLMPADDPRVIAAKTTKARRHAIQNVMTLAESLRNKDEDTQLALLDKLVNAARSARDAVNAARIANH